MLEKLKEIAHKLPYSHVWYDKCACGYKKYKRAVWVALAFLGLILFLA
jgi:hypothetical protein